MKTYTLLSKIGPLQIPNLFLPPILTTPENDPNRLRRRLLSLFKATATTTPSARLGPSFLVSVFELNRAFIEQKNQL